MSDLSGVLRSVFTQFGLEGLQEGEGSVALVVVLHLVVAVLGDLCNENLVGAVHA